MSKHRSAKLATAAAIAAGGLTLATGLAVAGVLPDQASDTAEEKVADVRDTTTTSSTSTTSTTSTTKVETDDVTSQVTTGGQGEGERPTDTHGYEVSTFVHESNLEGREFGEAVSEKASSNAGTTGTVTAEEHQTEEHQPEQNQSGKSSEHRPSDD